MENDIIIDETTITEFYKQDKECLEALLSCDYLNSDTDPLPIPKQEEELNWTFCRCGAILYSKTYEFSCGICGCKVFKPKKED